MFAYLIPDLDPRAGMDGLRAHPAGRRLVGVGRWQTSSHGGGALVSLVGHPFNATAYGAPVDTFDGMQFLPPKSWGNDPKAALRRDALPDCTCVDTVGGPLLVALATRAPRPRRFSGGAAIGRPSGELAEAAFTLWDRISADENIQLDDQGLARVIFLAVAACYRITEEAVDALGWMTTQDDGVIIKGVFGLDPKAEAGDGGTPPLPPPALSDPPV